MKRTLSQIEHQSHYQKIGRLRKPIADHIGRKPADIYIDENHLKHIFSRHKEDLAKIGLTPQMFIDLVVNNFNRIYKGSGQSILLVEWSGAPKIVAIELNLAFRKGFYEVKTAFMKPKNKFKQEYLLWEK